MSAPPVEIPPMMIYVFYYTWLMGAFIIAGIVALLAYPAHYRKVALFWGITGLSQIVVSGFIYYPDFIFIVFPYATLGLFALTCGIVMATYSSITSQQPSNAMGVGFLILGCILLLPFVNFLIMYFVLVQTEFLVSGLVTIACGILILYKAKFSLRTKEAVVATVLEILERKLPPKYR